MTTRIYFRYDFHAVGQGLFATGHLQDCKTQKFTWVLDCGSNKTTKPRFLKREIDHFIEEMNGGRVGLFCLSHFDEDHIKGAGELLSSRRIDVLVMPYFPLVKRIQIALGISNISEDYLAFLIDPVGYMFEAAGGELREIILIAGGGAPPEQTQGDAPQDSPAPSLDDPWKVRYPNTEKAQSPADQIVQRASTASRCKSVRVFTHQKPFTVGDWEFMFYNEYIPGKDVPALERKVSAIILKHRRKDGSFDGIKMITELKKLYVKFFPGAVKQNTISLVIYAGPIDRHQMKYSNVSGRLMPADAFENYPLCFCDWAVGTFDERKVSIGYFGDFPLTTPARVKAVQNHFGLHRWNCFQVVQIPHHGSKLSWYPRVSKMFLHGASVISSARHSKHHPSQNVLDDFEKHGLVFVNEYQRASFYGWIKYQSKAYPLKSDIHSEATT